MEIVRFLPATQSPESAANTLRMTQSGSASLSGRPEQSSHPGDRRHTALLNVYLRYMGEDGLMRPTQTSTVVDLLVYVL